MKCAAFTMDGTFELNGVSLENCIDFLLFTPAEVDTVNLLLNGGFDAESFGIGFGGIISLWITGLAIGMIISQVRKVK